MTAILDHTHLSKDLRELPESLQMWVKETNVLQDMWTANLISFENDFYSLKGSKIKKMIESKWSIIKKQLNLDIPLSEVNKKCNGRISPDSRTEGLINILLTSYTIEQISKGLENIINLHIRNNNVTYLSGLNVYLHSVKFPSLLEIEIEERSEFKWS